MITVPPSLASGIALSCLPPRPMPPALTPTPSTRYRIVGDDWLFRLVFLQSDGLTPYDLTGAALTADVYLDPSSDEPVVRILTGSGITVSQPTTGVAVLVVPASITMHAIAQDPATATIFPTCVVVGITSSSLHRSVVPIAVCPFAGRTTPWPVENETAVRVVLPWTGPQSAQPPIADPGSATADVLSFPIAGASSFVAAHGFSYRPKAWLVDSANVEVETDITYQSNQVLISFPSPFTGTLYLG